MQLDLRCDHHTHTGFSDGSGSVEKMVAAAIARNLAGIVITDHSPLPFATGYALSMEEIDRYRLEISTVRTACRETITVGMGMEFEFIPEQSSWLDPILRLEWDHRIVSIHHLGAGDSFHLVNGTAGEFAPLLQAFNNDGKALCTRYYQTLQKGIATGSFDSVGHLDVIKKHNREFAFFNEDEPWYRELIHQTLECIKEHGISMEINTGGFNHPPAEQYPSSWIIRAAREKNIPLVLSSDAHTPAMLAQHFEKFA